MSSSSKIVLDVAPRVLRRGEAGWPAGFEALPKPPVAVWLAGQLPNADAIAIVGTRFADPQALAFAQRLGAALAISGVSVVSGGARGVDAAAHRGALDAGGSTVAVLATGLMHAYPPGHGPLFSAIARQGALVTEAVATVHRPERWTFLRRNQLIAALASAVVVVQAPEQSGALSTAAWAKHLKKPVLAVPAAPWDLRGAGCLRLLRDGARICTSVTDVLSVRPSAGQQVPLPGVSLHGSMGRAPGRKAKNDERLRQSTSTASADPSSPSTRVLERLAQAPAHPDELVRVLDLQPARVHEALLTLVLAGLVHQAVDGTYTRNLD